MSVQSAIKRKTAPDIRARKNGDPIVMLTSYHAHTAALVDRYCDAILVGDSLGNVMHGFETTVPVTLEMMILQGRAVMRGSKQALVDSVVGHSSDERPFGTASGNKLKPGLHEIQRAHVLTAYAESGNNISKAARRLGVSRNTIYRALRDPQG